LKKTCYFFYIICAGWRNAWDWRVRTWRRSETARLSSIGAASARKPAHVLFHAPNVGTDGQGLCAPQTHVLPHRAAPNLIRIFALLCCRFRFGYCLFCWLDSVGLFDNKVCLCTDRNNVFSEFLRYLCWKFWKNSNQKQDLTITVHHTWNNWT